MPEYFFNKFLTFTALAASSVLFILAGPLSADEPSLEIYPPRVAVMADPQKSPPLAALSEESVAHIVRTFNVLGRLLPEENNRIAWAMGSIKGTDKTFYEQHVEAAGLLKSDILVTITFTTGARINFADLRVRAINPAYRALEKNTRVRSRILQNLPLKLAREIAALHSGMPVRARITGRTDDGLLVINAGEWNGLSTGRHSTMMGSVEITRVGMFNSLVRAGDARPGDTMVFPIRPDDARVTDDIDRKLEKNAVRTYGVGSTLLRNQDDENRFVTGTCIINPGGSLCLGGYGTFLSTHHMGFQNPTPATGGMIASSGAYVTQLVLPLAMTRFRSNFFPWVSDSDKPEKVRNLQVFLWCTIPLTFSAGYFDQLAYQYLQTEHLPPFFLYRDNMATLLSFIVPGGGLFYKGHRLAGWSYYFSEMGLAGYSVYNWNNGSRGKYALGVLGIIKAIEMLNAYLMPSAFRFFNMETERDIRDFSLHLEMRPTESDESVFNIAAMRRF